MKKRTLKDYSILALFGYIMGAANVIPGVSGGTVAFILGFFKELIESLKAFFSKEAIDMALHFRIREMYEKLPWRFLASIVIGAALAVVTLSKVLSYLLKNEQVLIYAFFIGLIVASVICCFKMVKKWSAVPVVMLIVGIAVGYALVRLTPTQTPNTWWCQIICGVIAISAMILPGISGSFMLLILGQYENLLGTINNFVSLKPGAADFQMIIFVAVGAVLGLCTMAYFLSWLFKKYNDGTVAMLIGFMLGSLVKLWPWQEVTNKVMTSKGEEKILETKLTLPSEFGGQFWAAVGLIVLGVLITLAIEYMAAKPEQKTEKIETTVE